MKDQLMTFQQRAVERLRDHCAAAHNEYRQTRQNQVVSFTAPTGAGKTIILSALIEDIYSGTDKYAEQPEAVFVWLSDSPELNLQSKEKIDSRADKIRLDQCVVIADDSFDREVLEDGHIYFLNTQKLSRTSNLTQHSDSRQYTIYETLANTISEKSDRLYFIIDEAHRGMRGQEAGRATSIMQRFILGEEKLGLPPVPVVIGMSATIQRFEQLVRNSAATRRPVKVSAEEVRASGLLKDRVIIYYPKDASERNDMAILQAATEEWLRKCEHWKMFCESQQQWQINPVFVVQVLNGTGGSITETDLDECLRLIEQKAGMPFATGEVVHCFGDTKSVIQVNGLDVPYEEPSKIQNNRTVRVVFFKETLSTGWDCPRAETMMSFRRYTDATAIAQLLGRMVRTPMQQHIQTDDVLNEVQLFLPYFDAEKVSQVVDELQNAEGGELPTDVYGDEWERGIYTVLTTRPAVRHTTRQVNLEGQLELFGTGVTATSPESGEVARSAGGVCQDARGNTRPPTPSNLEGESQVPLDLEFDLDRTGIVRFVNSLALRSYQIRNYQTNDSLRSLFDFTTFLLISGLDVSARESVTDAIVERIHTYIQSLKQTGGYTAAKEQVLHFEMLANVYDAFGERIRREPVSGNLFSESQVDLDRQVRIADRQLRDEEVSKAYARRYGDIDNHISEKADVILFAGDEGQMADLIRWAEKEFNRLNDQYRQRTTRLPETLQNQYRTIVRNSAEVSHIPFCLGENIFFTNDTEGDDYDDHLFVSETTGTVRIRLNGWERRVIAEERKRADFRCWYRNPSRGKDALTLYHVYKGAPKPFYPYFLIVRRENGDYVLDILEPHNDAFDDNVSKAKALAQYAAEHPALGRVQLIRKYNNTTGESLKRLDFARSSELRQRVMTISQPDELDNLFTQYGE